MSATSAPIATDDGMRMPEAPEDCLAATATVKLELRGPMLELTPVGALLGAAEALGLVSLLL
jgi:hypothetical protein